MPEQRKVSEEFWNAILGGGSLVADCEFCGRTHFYDGDSSAYEEGEFEGLKAKQKENPDKYISSDDDSIPNGVIDGKQAVRDCPCNSVRKYEDLFWNHKNQIANYLTARANKEEKEAKETSKLAQIVQTATKH